MRWAIPLARDEIGVFERLLADEADAATSFRLWGQHRCRTVRSEPLAVRVIAILDHLDEERDRVPAAIERLAHADLEAAGMVGKGSEALLPTPALQACASMGLERLENFSEFGLKLACLLPITEEERLFHDSSKLAVEKPRADGFCPATATLRRDKNGSTG
jgi:hypothetical protein